MKKYFITGTDTDVGKTVVTVELLKHLNKRGFSTLGVKPVAASTIDTPDGKLNEDVYKFKQASSIKLPYEQINPILYELPASPHIGAKKSGCEFSVAEIVKLCQPALQTQADYTFIEGAGGWLVPINDTETVADLAKALHVPIILVVGMRLGCLNHALLTYENIRAMNLPFAGWIANHLDPNMNVYKENIETLKKRIKAPMLGEVPYLDKGAENLQINFDL